MDPALLATLRIHNPWLDRPGEQPALLAATLPDPFVERHRRLELRPGRAELVVGPRQAGKSTWIRAVLTDFEAPILVLHAEEPRIRELAQSPALALDALAEVLSPETLLLFEEIQHLAEAPLFIKGLVDLDRTRRIVATSSSSFAFSARRASLWRAGRDGPSSCLSLSRKSHRSFLRGSSLRSATCGSASCGKGSSSPADIRSPGSIPIPRRCCITWWRPSSSKTPPTSTRSNGPPCFASCWSWRRRTSAIW